MGHLESLLGQVERHDYPVGRDLTLAARAELAEREAEIERLTAALNRLMETIGDAETTQAESDEAWEEALALSGAPTTKPQASTQTAEFVPVEERDD
jgi:anti-sigma factor RsiW